jgi:ribonuclease P protein component
MGGDDILRDREEIRQVYARGTSYSSPDVVLVLLRSGSDQCRLVVVASRKVGGAVRRNRAKRLLREAHRRLRPLGDFKGMDLALIARPGAPDRPAQSILEQLADLYRRAQMIVVDAPECSGETTHSS